MLLPSPKVKEVSKISLCKIKLKGHLQAQQKKRAQAKQQLSPQKLKKMACATVQNPPTVDSGSTATSWSPLYTSGGTTPTKLDSDTINYIHRIYCRECRMEEQRKQQKQGQEPGGGGGSSGSGSGSQPTSPQQAVDDISIQQNKDKNKESLKRKLMLRRSVNELVDQGIYPPLRTPPAFAEQRKQLERAKTGDLLKHKIQTRPARQSLVEQHILEDTNVDPSLQDRQRQLKRARLQDSLTERLIHRPGPLELVEGNILQIDPKLTDAIRDGNIHFPKSSTDSYVFDEDSNTSDGVPSPSQFITTVADTMDTALSHASSSSGGSLSIATGIPGIPSPPDITPLLQKMQTAALQGQKLVFTQNIQQVTTQPLQNAITNSSISLSSSSSPPLLSSSKSGNTISITTNNSSSSRNISRIKKKNHKNSAPKSKVIKFHEYKGPPNAKASSSSSSSSNSNNNIISTAVAATPTPSGSSLSPSPSPDSDTPYHVLLQQQQLFLQWQLEFQQKNLPFILPAQKEGSQSPSPGMPSSTITSDSSAASMSSSFVLTTTTPTRTISTPSPAPMVPQPPPPPPPPPPKSSSSSSSTQRPARLDDLKVAELKAECKKLNLPVSGPKPNLLERLRPYAEMILNNLNNAAAHMSVSHPAKVSTHSVSSISSVSSIPSVSSLSSLGSPQPVSSAESSPAPPSVASIHNIQSISGLINIQPVTPQSVAPSDDISMNLGSPPQSPATSELNLSHGSVLSIGPMSPDNTMDMNIASPPMVALGQQHVIKNQLTSSQSMMPMAVDQMSRPPSVAPMDIDLNGSQSNLAASLQAALVNSPLQVLDRNQNPNPTGSPQPPPPPPPPLLPGHTQANAQTSTQVSSQASTQANTQSQTQAQIQPQFISVQVPPQAQLQVGQPQVISQDELVRQQQRQIDELRKQLFQSQFQLKQAQEQSKIPVSFMTQQQLLQQQQIQQQQQTLLQNLSIPMAVSSSVENTVSSLAQSITQQAIPQSVGAVTQIQIQPVQPQPLTRTTESTATLRDTKPDINALQNILQSHTMQQSIAGLGQPKVLISSAPTSQSFILQSTTAGGTATHISGAQTVVVTSSNTSKPRVYAMPINGLNVTDSSRASSVPSSPVGSHGKLQRSTTNPFLIPVSKEPPKYDEVVKPIVVKPVSEQNGEMVTSSGSLTQLNLHGITKQNASAMDDVLEILIRSGELPASAAQEPPPTPKTEPGIYTSGASTKTATITSPSRAPGGSGAYSRIQTQGGIHTTKLQPASSSVIQSMQPPSINTMPPPGVSGIHTSGVSTIVIPASSAIHFTNPGTLSNSSAILTNSIVTPITTVAPLSPPQVPHLQQAPSPKTGTSITSSNRKDPPPPLTLSSNITASNTFSFPSSSNDLTSQLSDFTPNLADLPFITMDWSDSDTNMNTLDLTDMLDMPQATFDKEDNKKATDGMLLVPANGSGNQQGNGSVHGSEPNLNVLGLGDSDMLNDTNAMNMDVSDWLDVIMPSTGLTPLSANAPTSFSADPILTPKPQDVLDLFNMDESDLYTPTDLTGTSFEKAMETSLSTSKS